MRYSSAAAAPLCPAVGHPIDKNPVSPTVFLTANLYVPRPRTPRLPALRDNILQGPNRIDGNANAIPHCEREIIRGHNAGSRHQECARWETGLAEEVLDQLGDR